MTDPRSSAADQVELEPELDPEAAHLDEFRAADLGEAGGLEHDVIEAGDELEAGAIDATAEPAAELLDKESFWIVFRSAWSIPGGFVPAFAPLAVQPAEEPSARAASDAIHDLLAIYFPQALRPMGQTATLVLTAFPFMWAKVQLVRMILAEQRAAKIAAAEAAQKGPQFASSRAPRAANDSSPPARSRPADQAPPEPARPASSPMAWMDQEQAA